MRSFRCFCRFRIKAKSSSTTAMRQMIMPIGASAARIDNHEISSEIKKPGPSIPGYPGSGFTNLWPRHKILVEAKTQSFITRTFKLCQGETKDSSDH